jgi:hypothetical protein
MVDIFSEIPHLAASFSDKSVSAATHVVADGIWADLEEFRCPDCFQNCFLMAREIKIKKSY